MITNVLTNARSVGFLTCPGSAGVTQCHVFVDGVISAMCIKATFCSVLFKLVNPVLAGKSQDVDQTIVFKVIWDLGKRRKPLQSPLFARHAIVVTVVQEILWKNQTR